MPVSARAQRAPGQACGQVFRRASCALAATPASSNGRPQDRPAGTQPVRTYGLPGGAAPSDPRAPHHVHPSVVSRALSCPSRLRPLPSRPLAAPLTDASTAAPTTSRRSPPDRHGGTQPVRTYGLPGGAAPSDPRTPAPRSPQRCLPGPLLPPLPSRPLAAPLTDASTATPATSSPPDRPGGTQPVQTYGLPGGAAPSDPRAA